MVWLRETWTQIWITLVVAAVSLALYTSIGRQLIPLLETYRPDLEQQLSALLQQPVAIGQLEGDWRVLSPVVHLNDVQLGPVGDGVYIAAMEAELDVSATLFYRQPVFRNITIEGMIAELHQLSKSQWRIGSQWLLPSLASASPELQPEPEPEPSTAVTPTWLSWLSLQQALLLKNWEITAYDQDNTREDLIIDQMLWRNQNDSHDLDGQLAWGREQMTNLRLMATLEGELWPWQRQNGEVYAHFESQDWSRWIPADLPAGVRVERFVAAAEAWLSIRNGDLNALHLNADIPQLDISTRAEPVKLSAGHLTATGHHNGDDWHLLLTPEFAEPLPFQAVTLSAIALNQQKGWQIGIPELDVGATRMFLDRHQLLPEPFSRYVRETQGRGQARQVRISLLPGDPWKVDVRAALQEVSSTAYHGIPAVTDLSGELHLQPQGGVLRLAQEDFALHLEGVYEQAWQLQQFDGAFYWAIHPDYAQLQLRDARAHLLDNAAAGSWPLAAEFAMALPRQDSPQELNMSVLVGLADAPASLKHQLVPTLLDDSVRSWIDAAILAGQFSDGVFVLNGMPGSEHPQNSLTTQLYLEFEDARLRYLEEWPEVADLRGRLLMRSPALEVSLDYGSTLGGRLLDHSGRIRLAPGADGHTWLDVRAHLAGNSGEALQYLTDTPLAGAVNHALDDWQAQGQVKANLQLSMPLGVDAGTPDVDLEISLTDTELQVGSLNLAFSNLQGQMHYDTAAGLTAERLDGEIFGGRFTAAINSRPRSGGFDLVLSGQGEAQWAPFRDWLPLFLLDPMNGRLTYDTQLEIGQGGINFRLLSDLAGTQIDLPSPLGKAADETRSLVVDIHPGNETRINLNYNDQLRTVVALAGGTLERGQVYLGNTEPFLPSDPGLEIRGRVDEPLQAADWWSTWQRMMSLLNQDVDGTTAQGDSGATSHGPVRLVDINLAAVDAWGTPMGPTHVSAGQSWNEWNFAVESDLLRGTINMKPGNQPLQLNFDYIHMPHSAGTAQTPATQPVTTGTADDFWPTDDPLAELIPADLPALDMTLAELYVGDRNYGRWQIESRPVAGGLNVRILDSDMKALKVTGDVQWLRDGERHTTHLNTLSLRSDDVGKVQRAFRQEAIVEGKDMRSTLSLGWHGSPLAFNPQSLNGLVSMRIRDGSMAAEGTGALKAFGALNFASVARRLKLDFSDLYQSGVSFYSLKAKARIENGLLTFTEPLALDGPGAKFLMSGSTLMTDQTLDMKLVVTFPVSSTLPVVALLAGLAPPVAASIYVTEKLIGDEIARFTSASYDVTGSWEKPELNINQAFDDDIEGKKSRSLWDRVKSIFNIFGGD